MAAAAAMWAMTALSLGLLALRLYTRLRIVRFVGAEDHLYFWTGLLLLGFTACIQVAVRYGLGRSFWTLPPLDSRERTRLRSGASSPSPLRTSAALVVMLWSSICDFFAIFPWLVVWPLHMPRRDKLVLSSRMSSGVLAGGCGIAGTAVLARLDIMDYTWKASSKGRSAPHSPLQFSAPEKDSRAGTSEELAELRLELAKLKGITSGLQRDKERLTSGLTLLQTKNEQAAAEADTQTKRAAAAISTPSIRS
ncbi:uncharacterized protein B0T15DRAFT_558983 [Chaetomium strumarium]|uniref:Uncharacterized protein n=1 Tax=Chaetomium strumarium TaxID=1170767 RepID=A0AAJ0GRL8_9PEZI|nr:hypothetical protein B0T15DRAFT_558983 [Chaetomium strumarium]